LQPIAGKPAPTGTVSLRAGTLTVGAGLPAKGPQSGPPLVKTRKIKTLAWEKPAHQAEIIDNHAYTRMLVQASRDFSAQAASA